MQYTSLHDRFKKDREEIVRALVAAIPNKCRVSVLDEICNDSLYSDNPLAVKDILLDSLHNIVDHVERSKQVEKQNSAPEKTPQEPKNAAKTPYQDRVKFRLACRTPCKQRQG